MLAELGVSNRESPEAAKLGKKIEELLAWRSELAHLAEGLEIPVESWGNKPQQPEALFVRCRPGNELNCMYALASSAKAKLDSLGAEIAAKVDEVAYEAVELKPRERVCEIEPRHILDIVRGSLVASDKEALLGAAEVASRLSKIVRLENRFEKPHFNGYRDILMTLDCGGVLVELQIHLKSLKVRTERHCYDGNTFRTAGTSPTLELHYYFAQYFRLGGTIDVLKALLAGDRDVFERLCDRARSRRPSLLQLDFLLDKLGDLDRRSSVLLNLARDDPKQKIQAALVVSDAGLSAAQADQIRDDHGGAFFSRRVVRQALRPEHSGLYGLLVVNLLREALVPTSPYEPPSLAARPDATCCCT